MMYDTVTIKITIYDGTTWNYMESDRNIKKCLNKQTWNIKRHRNPIEIKSTMMFLVANWNTTSSSSYTMDIPWKPEEPHPQFPHDLCWMHLDLYKQHKHRACPSILVCHMS